MRKTGWAAGLMALGMMIWAAAGVCEGAETAEEIVPALALPELTSGALTEIPVEQDLRKNAIPPREEYYLYGENPEEPTGYADPSITVNLGRGRIYETNYLYARVRIASPTQLRTLLASPPGNLNTTMGHDLAKRVQSVIAINGDYCGGDDIRTGVIMRQGKLYRQKADGKLDLMVIDAAGDLRIVQHATRAEMEEIIPQAVNIFTFGPAMVKDGELLEIARNGHMASHKPAQRMALCQTGPLEYLLVTSEGPENEGSIGLTIPQFAELTAKLGAIQAYNLDGGSSSTVVFRLGDNNWKKINARSTGRVRELKDIIFFVSAWIDEE